MAERYGRPIDPNPSASPAQAIAAAVSDAPLSMPPPSSPTPTPAAVPVPRERPPTVGAPGVRAPGTNGPGTNTPGTERIDSQVQKAQEQLQNLRRQQEQIERQKRELEELSRRQEELETGRNEMVEKLTRALVVLERQSNDAQKRVEQLHLVGESFASHLSTLEAIQPKSWASADLQKELNRALGMVDHARTEYGQQRARFAADVAEGTASTEGAAKENPYEDALDAGSDKSFVYWLKAGLAFTLPLLLLGFIALFIFCWSLLAK